MITSPEVISTDNHGQTRGSGYVLLTSAYNEEENIGKTIESVLAQTQLPNCWVIVSDGSLDRTDEIVQNYASKHDRIRFLRIIRRPGRSFGSKVRALQQGSKELEGIPYDFIGNLDADVTIEPQYFEKLLNRLEQETTLGLVGGYVTEETNGEFQDRRQNRVYSVAHAAQLVRRKCYEEIGGYAVLEFGGEDWHAQISAQMKGWDVQAFPDLKIYHHRHTGEADNLLRHKFRQGRMDYSFGSDPFFEALKCAQRLPDKPIVLGATSRFLGFCWAWLCRDERPVSGEFVSFLRTEQRQRMSALFALRRGSPSLTKNCGQY